MFRAPAVRFVLSANARCPAGTTHVSSAADCNPAAKVLGLNDTNATHIGNMNYPVGCMVYGHSKSVQGLYFNGLGSPSSTNSHTRAVCRYMRATTNCSFEAVSVCGWKRSGGSQWLHGKTTPSVSTGPRVAHGGSSFVFLETSTTRQGTVSYLASPTLPSGTQSVQFYYHMHGSSMGTLALEAIRKGAQTVLWTRSGEQHAAQQSNWSATGYLQLPAQTLSVRFKGVRGSNYMGDMAVDVVTFSTRRGA